MRLRGTHNNVTVKLASYARSLAAYEVSEAMKWFARAKAEPDDHKAAILIMYGESHARDAISFAMFALESAELLGWYPATNKKSDWYFGAREESATATQGT